MLVSLEKKTCWRSSPHPFLHRRMVHIPLKPVIGTERTMPRYNLYSKLMMMMMMEIIIMLMMMTPMTTMMITMTIMAYLTDPASRKANPHCMKKMTIALKVKSYCHRTIIDMNPW